MQTQPRDVPDRDGMPGFGFGTYRNEDHDTCAESVRTALEVGYRHIDTAQFYDNEAAVGDGIEAADVDRDDVFLASKVWFDDLAHDDVLEAARESLDRLGTDYLDLLYVHWPTDAYDPEATLPAFEKLREDGLIEHIGVSNFDRDHIETARSVLDAPIFANQIEVHPLLQQESLRGFCSDAGIEVVAYAPIARTEVFDVDVISEIADDHGVSEAQVSLAWARQSGLTPIPKATSADHIEDNWASLSLALDDDELARIDAIEEERRLVDPDFMSW